MAGKTENAEWRIPDVRWRRGRLAVGIQICFTNITDQAGAHSVELSSTPYSISRLSYLQILKLDGTAGKHLPMGCRNIYQDVCLLSSSGHTNENRPNVRGRPEWKSRRRSTRSLCLLRAGDTVHHGPAGRHDTEVGSRCWSNLLTTQISGSPVAASMVVGQAECTRGRILRANQQIGRRMLQPLGWRMLPTGPGCVERHGTRRVSQTAISIEYVPSRRLDEIPPRVLSERRGRTS